MSEDEILDLAAVRFDPLCVMRVTAAFAESRMVLPICVVDGDFIVAMANPGDVQTVAQIRRAVGMPVVAHRATPEQIRAYILRFFGVEKSLVEDEDSEAVKLVDSLLRNAYLRKSSDIHFDPEETYTRVRFRTDGVLEEVMRFPAALHPSVASRIKIMADLDIAERREPQDGALTWEVPDETAKHGTFLDVRVATLPVTWGERITLRLLEKETRQYSLATLGMVSEDLEAFRRVLAYPNGLVLMTGPTGSGKSTSLYAAIQHLLEMRPLNILTVEDPVEYQIPGISQAQVDAVDKVSFSKALRSLLRHDPDVIMIGEIRDEESLDVAVKAALTGHLVLSTLHTNDAVNAVTRLTDMRLQRHLLAATLRLSVAQRLVRSLCPHCRMAYAVTEAEAYALGRPELAGRTAYKAGGCLACGGCGLNGRVGVFEMFAPDSEISSMIAAGASENDLRRVLAERQVKTLLDDGANKCLAGITTVDEVLRTVGGRFMN